MTTPTQRLTNRVARKLDRDVVLAVRVRRECTIRGRPDKPERPDETAMTTPMPAAGLPIVPMLRGLKRSVTSLVSPDQHVNQVLAFTPTGDRIIMGRSRFLSLHPTDMLRIFPKEAPISVNLRLLTEELIPELSIDGQCYSVNSIDFGVLTRAVAEGRVDEPELSDQLTPLYRQTRALATSDPNTLRALMHNRSKAI